MAPRECVEGLQALLGASGNGCLGLHLGEKPHVPSASSAMEPVRGIRCKVGRLLNLANDRGKNDNHFGKAEDLHISKCYSTDNVF